jgi:hypothetical protein
MLSEKNNDEINTEEEKEARALKIGERDDEGTRRQRQKWEKFDFALAPPDKCIFF